jgi:hypothetical protein
MENLLMGNLITFVEDVDGIIEYEWKRKEIINVIKEMGYIDANEIANEVITLADPYDFLEMMRNKNNVEDLDILELTIDMFKESIRDEFKLG